MDRVAIVTGASRCIGRATAIRLARDFGAVALVARTRETLAETADAIRVAGAEPLLFVRDLREPGAPEPPSLRRAKLSAGSTPSPALPAPSPRPTCSRSRTSNGTTALRSSSTPPGASRSRPGRRSVVARLGRDHVWHVGLQAQGVPRRCRHDQCGDTGARQRLRLPIRPLQPMDHRSNAPRRRGRSQGALSDERVAGMPTRAPGECP